MHFGTNKRHGLGATQLKVLKKVGNSGQIFAFLGVDMSIGLPMSVWQF